VPTTVALPGPLFLNESPAEWRQQNFSEMRLAIFGFTVLAVAMLVSAMDRGRATLGNRVENEARLAVELPHRYVIQHPRTDPTPARVEEYRKNREFFRQVWWDDGTILAGGREFAGLSVSGCYQRGKMSCLSCHRMHGGDPDDQLKPGMRGARACTGCHTEPRFTTEVEKHTFHRPESS